MDSHFTYFTPYDSSELKQGDVLVNDGALAELISKVHPHYSGSEYKYFQVLTQSCDLVRRGRKKACSTRYITLAAVRDLDTVVSRTVEKETEASKIFLFDERTYCSDKNKQRIAGVLESLFNNNDKNHFFLKACPDAGLETDSCTFLHLSIAVRAQDHFETCLEAKILELNYGFQAKLGWLVGNLYSRVGTKDFVPTYFAKREEFMDYIYDVLEQQVAWIPAASFAVIKSIVDRNDETKDMNFIIQEAIEEQNRKNDEKLSTLAEKIRMAVNSDSEGKEKIINILKNQKAICINNL